MEKNETLDKILSIFTLLGLVFIFGGFLLKSVFPWAGVFIILGLLLIFIQSVITLCTWKQNRTSENVAAIGFCAGLPVAIIFVIIYLLK